MNSRQCPQCGSRAIYILSHHIEKHTVEFCVTFYKLMCEDCGHCLEVLPNAEGVAITRP